MTDDACVFCGHPRVRHRLEDMICARIYAGESVESVAEDYALTAEDIAVIVTQEVP